MPRILIRGDTAAKWTTANPVLAAREPAIETDTFKLKIGNGTTAWTSLPYWDPGAERKLADGTWQVTLSANKDTGVMTFTAVGPGPTTKTLTWNPSTGAVSVDGAALATQQWVLDTLRSAVVIEPMIVV